MTEEGQLTLGHETDRERWEREGYDRWDLFLNEPAGCSNIDGPSTPHPEDTHAEVRPGETAESEASEAGG